MADFRAEVLHDVPEERDIEHTVQCSSGLGVWTKPSTQQKPRDEERSIVYGRPFDLPIFSDFFNVLSNLDLVLNDGELSA